MTHIFIVNPNAGRRSFSEELRMKLAKLEGLDYYVFNTRYAGYEGEIIRRVREVFPDEKLRFYSCGGSGTLRNMLNGFTDFYNVEIAMYPKGMTNDFIHMFPEDFSRFFDIEELIHGDVVHLDYIATNHGICLNNFSMGLDTHVLLQTQRRRESCLFGQHVPTILSVINSVFFTPSNTREFIVSIDGNKKQDKFSQLIFGNGAVLSGMLHFCENPDATDGVGDYLLLPEGVFKLPMLYAMARENYSRIKESAICGSWKKIRITSRDGNPFVVNQDGYMIDGYAEWELQIVPEGLPFVVPKGVTA